MCWSRVHISPESRVRVEQGAAPPELVQGGTRLFLVKVLNDAGVTAPLAVAEPEHRPRLRSRRSQSPEPKHVLTDADVRDRWADMSIYTQPPMRQRLSGLGIEYVILQVYSRDAGPALGARQLQRRPGQPGRRLPQRRRSALHRPCRRRPCASACRTSTASRPPPVSSSATSSTASIPNISKRLAPDFYFQPQVYRPTARPSSLPDGQFTVTASRGPEYLSQTKRVCGPAAHRS